MVDKDSAYLVPRLCDLAFSVHISLEESSGRLSPEGLWRRARSAGAFTPMEKRAYRIVDGIGFYTRLLNLILQRLESIS